MGVPIPEMNPDFDQVDQASAEALLSSLRTISPAERRKHASVFNYWQSIRKDREFPPIRDLDPLEIADAGPSSLLLEMIGGGEDAEIRHIGKAIKAGLDVDKVGEAPNPSLLSCVATRLPVVAACREAFAFEDEFETAEGTTRCWVTLMPFSATGTWIDYVYGFVSLKDGSETVEVAAEPVAPADVEPEAIEEVAELEIAIELEPEAEPEVAVEPEAEIAPEQEPAPEPISIAQARTSAGKAGFSAKFFETLANVGGFYGKPVGVELDPGTASLEIGETAEPSSAEEPLVLDEEAAPEEPPVVEEEPEEAAADVEEPEEPIVEEAEEPAPQAQPVSTLEDTLQSKLTEVRAKADEARQAKLRANSALYEGLSAAYDFALDAESAPEEYLRLVEAEGLKIQLRSPMKPVAKLAFDGMCDDITIKQLEAILSWAFDEELPRGTLADRIESEGGIGSILSRAA